LEKLNKNLPQKYDHVIADAGYEGEENYVYLQEQKQKAFIKPQMYEAMKKRGFRKNIGKNM
jgi:hypothetical protein